MGGATSGLVDVYSLRQQSKLRTEAKLGGSTPPGLLDEPLSSRSCHAYVSALIVFDDKLF